MLNNSINVHAGKKFIRDKVKQARVEAKDSQNDLALALGKSRVTISDMERGRVVINANDLLVIAINYNKPISYFFPPELVVSKEHLTPIEEELLFLFYKLPNSQQIITVEYIREQVTIIKKVFDKINSDSLNN